MLIGSSFHWQHTIKATLPGEIVGEVCCPSACDKLSYNNFLINRLPLEQYLEIVIGSEMSANAPLEFLKAHAIISRSWAVGKILGCHPHGNVGKHNQACEIIGWDDSDIHTHFHVCSDDHCQRYQGIAGVNQVTREAVRTTAGLVITDTDRNVIDARFSKCCGGRTEQFDTCWQDIEMPCLESVDDPWCNPENYTDEEWRELLSSVLKDYDKSTSGGYNWQTFVTRDKIKHNLKLKFGRDVGDVNGLRPIRRGPSGRISLIELEGSHGKIRIGKELMIRRLLSDTHLFSSNFDILREDDGFKLTGKGWGHGVGLCQIGAAAMAFKGYNANEILARYYRGSRISHLSSIF